MEKYIEVETIMQPFGGTHRGTMALGYEDPFPEKLCLADIEGDAEIPAEYDRENDSIKLCGDNDDFEAFKRDVVDNYLPYNSVIFGGEVIVMLPPEAHYDDEFMAQIDGDLMLYGSVTHRFPSLEYAKEMFEQTASWWKSVRGNDDALMILKALHRLHEMPYPGPGFSDSNSNVRATFRNKEDSTDFAAITDTIGGRRHKIITLVNAHPCPEGKWTNNSREYSLASIGIEMLRLCMMAPRATSVHVKKK